jgi:HPt (histidine-containing phosphotransfer) domain-containing protein
MHMSSKPLINLELLKTITGADSALMKIYISTFIVTAGPSLSSLKLCLLEKNWKRMKSVAHSYKPQVAYMGIGELVDKIQKIEDFAATETNLEQLPELIHEVNLLSLLAIDELNQYIKTQ